MRVLTNQRRWNVNRGFTLIELMLAVMLLAIMMTIVYGVVVSTLQAQRTIEEITQSTEIGPALIAQIREDLEGAFLPDDKGEYFSGVDRPGATGDRDRIDFVTSRIAYGSGELEEDPLFHSVNEVGYQMRDNPNDSTVGILYRRLDYFLDEEPLRGGRLVELYDRVVHFGVQYWVEEQWVPKWDSKANKGKLPEAIRIELRIRVTVNEEQESERSFVTTLTFPQ